MTAWQEQPGEDDSEAEGPRYRSGGYDFGGYVPGEDYLPKKHRWRYLFSAIGVVLIIAMIIWSVVVFL